MMKIIIKYILTWAIMFALIFLSFDVLKAVHQKNTRMNMYQLNDYIYSEELTDRTVWIATNIEDILEDLPEEIKENIINKYEIMLIYDEDSYAAKVNPLQAIIYVNLNCKAHNYEPALRAIIYHEVGHTVQYKTMAFDEELYFKYKSYNGLEGPFFDTDYTHSSIKEFYATVFSIYMTDPVYLYENYEDLYEYISEKTESFPRF